MLLSRLLVAELPGIYPPREWSTYLLFLLLFFIPVSRPPIPFRSLTPLVFRLCFLSNKSSLFIKSPLIPLEMSSILHQWGVSSTRPEFAWDKNRSDTQRDRSGNSLRIRRCHR